MIGPVRARLPDGRPHFQHGPIDLVILADGPPDAVRRALDAAWERFSTILTELVGELPLLRAPLGPDHAGVTGPVAHRMAIAAKPHAADGFVTAMAAVAGAVADETLTVMRATAPLRRIAVNDGGDIALHLAPGERFRALIADHQGGRLGVADIASDDGIGGIATSGRHGRSHSLGCADSVTVLAANAAAADVAATLVANAVDLPGHPAITRAPAATLSPDSDLGDRLVVTGCGALDSEQRGAALDSGAAAAEHMREQGLLSAAFLHLQGETRIVGDLPGEQPALGTGAQTDAA